MRFRLSAFLGVIEHLKGRGWLYKHISEILEQETYHAPEETRKELHRWDAFFASHGICYRLQIENSEDARNHKPEICLREMPSRTYPGFKKICA